jgi:hypothetical protein
MRKVSQKVNSFLEWLSSNKIDNLISENTLTLITKNPNGFVPPVKLSLEDKTRAQKLSEQLPAGIFVTPEEVVDMIRSSVKYISTESLNYSPMTLTFKEFGPCKLILLLVAIKKSKLFF